MKEYVIVSNEICLNKVKHYGNFEPFKDQFFCTLEAKSQEEVDKIKQDIRQLFTDSCFLGIKEKNFRPKAFFFDMDGTIIKEESIVELARTVNLEKKMDKVGKERKIRKQKQDEEVTKRTGKPFKQMKDPE